MKSAKINIIKNIYDYGIRSRIRKISRQNRSKHANRRNS
nr:MAG TPA: hypothetical protein [Microviridae sp.]